MYPCIVQERPRPTLALFSANQDVLAHLIASMKQQVAQIALLMAAQCGLPTRCYCEGERDQFRVQESYKPSPTMERVAIFY